LPAVNHQTHDLLFSQEEETVEGDEDGMPQNETEYYEALVAELEAESAALDENDRRKLLSYRRILKGKLLSQLRHSVLKQVSAGKVADQKTELLQADQKAEVKWYTVNCTVPEKRVADLLRTNMAKYAPNEEVTHSWFRSAMHYRKQDSESRGFSCWIVRSWRTGHYGVLGANGEEVRA
jgi:hypothetical protein